MKSRGKLKFSEYFKELKKGDKVAVVRELSLNPKFPTQIQGRTGTVEEKRGTSYVVKINDLNKEKKYIIHPIHLKIIK